MFRIMDSKFKWNLIFYIYIKLTLVSALDNKIFQGTQVEKGKYPFVVSIVAGTNYCGGSIVSTSKIISAGHCFEQPKISFKIDLATAKVTAGTTDIVDYETGYQQKKLKSYQVHKDFKNFELDKNSFQHDVAVGELDSPFEFTKNISPLKLASGDEDENKKAWEELSKNGKTCVAVGWGATKYKVDKSTGKKHLTKSSNVLLQVEIKPMSVEECKKNIFEGEDFGVGCCSAEVGSGVCEGDSGSPLICDGIVFGHVRSGPMECGDTKVPNLFTLYWAYIKYYELATLSATDSSANSLTIILLLIISIIH